MRPTLPRIDLPLSAAKRAIRLRLWTEQGVRDDLLLVKHASGSEAICGGFAYCLLCVATQAGMELKQFMAMPAELQFVTDTGDLRSVCGVVDGAVEGEADGGLATYQLIVRDALSILEKGSASRVFTDKNELQITELVLANLRRDHAALARVFDFETWRVKTDYPQRAFTMQHNESTAAFLRRLWRRRGINWFFKPGATAGGAPAVHTLVLFDQAYSLAQNAAGSVRYHRDDGTERRDSVTAWHASRNLSPGAVTRQSWDYQDETMNAARHASVNQQGGQGKHFAAGLHESVLDTPHAGDNRADYEAIGLLRIQYHEYIAKCYQGEAGVRALCPGEWCAISGHAEIDRHPPREREFVITALRVEAENNLPKTVGERADRLFALNRWRGAHADHCADQALVQASQERGGKYTCHFTCVRRGVPIVPDYDPRRDLPRIGPITAIVVGPPGETVYCDEQGRIKIRFPGCRPQERDGVDPLAEGVTGDDSAWVQVSTFYAGAYIGAQNIPRVGTLVSVHYMGNDPDKPVVIGALHGGHSPPPSFNRSSRLPGERYLSGIVSREIGGPRINQLRIDDTAGQISLQLASDHGVSQLNLGYLTAPRRNGAGKARGEGFELATREAGCIRSAKSLLISVWERLNETDSQLGNAEHVALMEDCLNLFKTLGQYAAEHQGLPLDAGSQAELKQDVHVAAGGSNIDPEGQGGKPTLSLTAPDGIAMTTPKTIVHYAGANIDTVAQHSLQWTSGQYANLNAGKGIALFAHKNGITHIAHYGKMLLQSQHDDTEINAAKNVKITASDSKIVMMAKEIHLIAEDGSFIKLGGGVTLGSKGDILHQASDFKFDGPASMQTDLPTFLGAPAQVADQLEIEFVDADGNSPEGEPIDLHFHSEEQTRSTSLAQGKSVLTDIPTGSFTLRQPKRRA
ncbi:MAG: type VI secretion system Vgr family protein [Pseudomonadota bacterium]